ncbi:DUF6456 domain-containing protein [Bosea sp. LjRoot237]|uniref:DUF6456 domain-containing protein n=1 Tax=Bosea sp. LjRoot237 TaxID=3342292 RepID=UPI003ECED15E
MTNASDEPEADNDAPPANPLDYLDSLLDAGDITTAQRDAGEIFRRLGQHALSAATPATTVSFPWRYANGVHSTLFEPKRLVVERYEAAREAAGNNERRREITRALVARVPDYPASPSLIAEGLRQIALHWWGKDALRTTTKHGVTLAATAANDNTPTPERAAHGTPATGRDNFERLLVRGQIDEDPEVATALYAAGLRYETEHAVAWSGQYASPDYSKPVVDGGSDRAPVSERQQSARERLRQARASMGVRYAEVVDAVVLQGLTLEAAGRRFCGYRQPDSARAAAKERLNAGLRSLAVHFGIAVRRKAA